MSPCSQDLSRRSLPSPTPTRRRLPGTLTQSGGGFRDVHQPLSAIDPVRIRIPDPTSRRDLLNTAGFTVSWRPELPRGDASDDEALECDEVVLVTVTSATPGKKHWVGAYSPPGAAVNETAPVKYAILHDVDASYLGTGMATVRFRLQCNRHDYDFVVFADDWERRQYDPATHTRVDTTHEAVAVARSPTARMRKEANEGPRKPRVSLVDGGESELTLAVTWSSSRGDDASPAVRWWREDASGVRTGDVSVTNATTSRFVREDMCGAPATSSGYRDAGLVHHAVLTGIDRSTDRFIGYELIDALGGFYPPTGERVSVPPPAGAAPVASRDGEVKPFTVAMFADMGRGTDDDAVTWHEYGSPAFNTSRFLSLDAAAGSIDAAFLFGDVSYAVGYQSVWDDFFEMITPWAAKIPFLVCPGNHEYDYTRSAWIGRRDGDPSIADRYGGADSGGECGVPTRHLLPGPEPANNPLVSGAWIATLGPIALVSMNTEVDFRVGSAQWSYLRDILASIDREKTPWVLFAGHRPGLVDSDWGKSCRGVDDATYVPRAYACGPKKPAKIDGNDDIRDASDVGVALEFQAHVWPLLMEHRVTAVFSGHNHVYQRHCAFDPAREGSGIDSHLDRIRALGPGEDADDETRSQYGKPGGCVSRPIWVRDGPGSTQVPGSGPGSWVYDRPEAPVSVVVGSAGASFTKNSAFGLSGGWETCGYCEAVMYEFGYLRVAALNDTHLRFEFLETQRGDGAVLDRFYITRDATVGGGMVEKGEGDGTVWWYVAGGCAMVAVAVAAFVVIRRKDIASSYAQLEEKEVQMRGIHGGAIDDV